MQKASFKIINHTETNTREIIAESFKNFDCINRDNIDIYFSDITKFRISSTLMTTIILSPIKGNNFLIDIICGGGKKNIIFQHGFGAEKSSLNNISKVLKEELEEQGLVVLSID